MIIHTLRVLILESLQLFRFVLLNLFGRICNPTGPHSEGRLTVVSDSLRRGNHWRKQECSSDVTLGTQVGQIGPKWDKSWNF